MAVDSAGVAVVTGATGFLGRAFTAELRTRGYEVRGIDVRPGPGVTVGDISRRGRWWRLLEGADLVVHAAAIVLETGDERSFWRVNVEGTRAVLDAAAAGGAGRVLHLSSKVVYGRDFPDPVDERAPVRMTGNPYTDTKVSAEHQALLAHAAGAVPVTVIRPGDVYGPQSSQWVVRVIEMMRSGLFVLFDGGSGILTPTYVDDVVDGGLAAALHPDGAGQVFNITGGEGVAAREFFGYYAEWLGKGMRSLPSVAVSALTGPVERVARGLGRQPPFSHRTLEYITHPGTYSVEKARTVLGWEPKVGLEEGMARTRAWLVEVGLVPVDDDAA